MNKSILLAFICAVLIGTGCSKNSIFIEVSNSSSLNKEFEDIEISWSDISERLPDATPHNIVVMSSNKEQQYQVIMKDDLPIAVLIQVSVSANTSKDIEITTGIPSEFSQKAFGRFAPERGDDFAWENNRIAFRVYGPALKANGEIINGMDIWAKRTDSLVIDTWYGHMDYHRDHGQGLDFYTVGRSLGAGIIAPLLDGKIILGDNFIDYKVLENGPLRMVVELSYDPLKVGDNTLIEKRIISLSANSNFNKITQYYFCDEKVSLDICSGIVLGKEGKTIKVDEENGIVSLIEPKNEQNGELFISTILGDSLQQAKEIDGHIAAISKMYTSEPFVYYAGYGWSKANYTPESWNEYAINFARSLKAKPLDIVIK